MRSISSFVATLILLFLTGVIFLIAFKPIIPHSEKKLNCANIQLKPYDASYDPDYNVLVVKFFNDGKAIPTDYLYVVIVDVDNEKHFCGKDTMLKTGCEFVAGTVEKIKKNIFLVRVSLGNSKWSENVPGGRVYFYMKGCGRVSSSIEIT